MADQQQRRHAHAHADDDHEPPLKKPRTQQQQPLPPFNQPKNLTFLLNPIHVTKLKHSIASLCDSGFNPQGLGLLNVTANNGFDITVRNPDTQIAANLFLKASGLINFHCNNPILNKIINLTHISNFLLDPPEDHSVTVSHLHPSSPFLTFQFESAPSDTVLNLELSQMQAQIEKIPETKFYCEAVFSCEILRELIEYLEEEKKLQLVEEVQHRGKLQLGGEHKLVSVDISEGQLTIFIGLLNSWQYKYVDDKVDYKGMGPGLKHHAWLQMRHLESMKKASNLAPRLLIGFLAEPPKSIMMRFNLKELGDLIFIHKAIKITTKSDVNPLGGTAAAVSQPQ